VSCKICLVEKLLDWSFWNNFLKIIFNIPAQKFFGSVQRKNFGQDLDSTKMGSNRFENFEQVQILIVRNIFFNISAQKLFGLVQSIITRHITRYVSTDYAVHFGPCKANPGVAKYRIPKSRFFGQCHQTIRVWLSGGSPPHSKDAQAVECIPNFQ
jgi:hypothetical protein